MYRYIQVDDNGIIIADSYFAVEWEDEHCIPVGSDFDPTDKKYDFTTGDWVEYIAPPTPEPPHVPTLQEQIDELKQAHGDAITNTELAIVELYEMMIGG